ncbi:Acyl-CoA synthetase (AMP-forming)/AMP-acid ligase II [Austwickia chelonae]|uniref:Putative 4-coumarate--CoA ligase n=1 Tax=Austwickia chelonae NBRC 105200 TaxID=1184607 RepID=K6VMJ1_9MICO|nr:AMP-binding protein [Austwickia chelonae]GAB77949.1 putative 4-coumarate--CoA ligase [Austwickia chelonae NBRC 105200]SEV92871.1 Acyl-CoA synthetase (AMP-forming)/AMP-acid ligase II [Austwickia chelonae]
MEYASSDPDIAFPDLRLDEFVLAALAGHDPDRTALVDGMTGRSLSYGELIAQVHRAASGFARLGIGSGDVVAVHLPNCPEFAVLLLAVSATGATVTPVSTSSVAEEVIAHVETSGAMMLVTHAAVWAAAGPGASSMAAAGSPVLVVARDDLPSPVHDGFTAYSDFLASAGDDGQVDLVTDDLDLATHPVCLPFSSGTTGLPKPVMLSHRALTANVLQFNAAVHFPEPQRTLAFLPFSHVYALSTTLLGGLVRGDTLVTMSSFQITEVLRLVREEQITLAFVVPPVATLLATHPQVVPDELSSLTTVVCGAAALDPSVARVLSDRLEVEVLQGYGLSEMSPVTHVMRRGAEMPVESVGTALPGIRFRVVDPATGVDVPPPAGDATAGPGELLVAGPNAMVGYLGDEVATAEMIDDEGWVHTGDLVTVDAQGCVRVVDRMKEVLKNRGYQVSPTQLEHLLHEYPGVRDVAVTGVRGDDIDDERPFALIVRHVGAGVGPSEEGLLCYVADRTAPHRHLAGVAFVEQIPRSASGKILRRRLPELLPAGVVAAR